MNQFLKLVKSSKVSHERIPVNFTYNGKGWELNPYTIGNARANCDYIMTTTTI